MRFNLKDMGLFLKKKKKEKGLTLIEVLISASLTLIVFGSLVGLLIGTIELVGNNKARIGALTLASDKMEVVRGLEYNNIGTIGGIPQGNIHQVENIVLNGISYTRRVLIQYVDDPRDGVGLGDSNGINTDYKRIKVEVSWSFKGRHKSVFLVSNIVPIGVETATGGGTLIVQVFNATGIPVPSAQVTVENNTIIPPVSVNISTNIDGKAHFPGAPAASGYEVMVTRAGYSTAQTHNPTTGNPNPSPSTLTVVEGQTTIGSFEIDVLSSKNIIAKHRTTNEVWIDTLIDSSNIIASASTTILAGDLVLLWTGFGYEASGYARIGGGAMGYLNQWQEVSWTSQEPVNTDIVYRIYHDIGGAQAIIPDADLPGNSIGFTSSPVDISGLSTTTYPVIYIDAYLTTSEASITPKVNSVNISYIEGPIPFANMSFSMRGDKTIGEDASGDPIYKYLSNLSTGAGGFVLINDLEWDNYTITINPTLLGYDIAEFCEPQPISIIPNTHIDTVLMLAPRTNNSILVDVRDSLGGLVENATVRLYRGIYDKTQTTSPCGQTFFEALTSATDYSIDVSVGAGTTTTTNIESSGPSTATVFLN